MTSYLKKLTMLCSNSITFIWMLKDFEKWNSVKQRLDTKEKHLFFKEGEIWWVSLGINIAVEVCGKGETNRPVLILRKLSKDSCIVLPLTSRARAGSWFRKILVKGQPNWILLHQIKFLSINHFQKRIEQISEEDFIEIKKELRLLLKFFL